MPWVRWAASVLLALQSGPDGGRVGFHDPGPASGIGYENVSGELDKRLIVSTLGSGVGLLDYDEDGDLDVYFANGVRIEGDRVVASGSDRLYRNDGGLRFTDVTGPSGLGDDGFGVGVAVADYDADGLVDLFVTRLGPNRLYRNRGDGTFVELAAAAGVADASWGTSAAFVDGDGDGDADLYVANYLEFDLDSIPPPGREDRCEWFGVSVMCGPKGLKGQPDVYFDNRGDGTFVDATAAAGLHDPTGAYALGVVAGDYDGDGDQDLYVANDSVPNFLYRNDGSGRFEESAFLAGVALSMEGNPQAGMGVDMGDLNGDGTLDVFVTNFSHETNNAYINHGGSLFTDAVGEANLHGPSWFSLGWGTRMVDFDNDGDLDVFVANGHVYPGVDETNLTSRYRQANQIFWNDGRGAFAEASWPEGDAMTREAASRAAAFADLDSDGDVDGIVVNIDETASLLDNRLALGSSWVSFRLVGRQSVRDGAGGVVSLHAGGRRQSRHAHSSGSFLSASDGRIHFGLGRASEARDVRVRWPGGRQQELGTLPGGRFYVVVEGVGVVRAGASYSR